MTTTINLSFGSIAVISNSIAGPIHTNETYSSFIGITGPDITLTPYGVTSDTSVMPVGNVNNGWAQNIVMFDYATGGAGTYYITMYGFVSSIQDTPKVGNSHIMVLSNLTKSP